MTSSRTNKLVALCLGAVAFVYYAILSAKDYTWVFVSYDSGDWLACANWWMVPQPYGSPLYIALCRLVGTLPGSQPINLTLLLSALPAAISVALVYVIVVRMTHRKALAVVSAVALLASTVALTQATVVEQYSLASMFLTLALYLRLNNKPKLTAVVLALGAAVHIILLLVAIFWLAADYRYWRKQWSAVGIAAVVVAASYSFVLVLMATDTPRLIAGGLSLTALNSYMSDVGLSVVGQLSIFELPRRLWDMSRVLLVMLGLTIVPIAASLRKPLTGMKITLLGTVVAAVGYYLLCVDYTTWTFLVFAAPSLAVLTGIGLGRLRPVHVKVVLVSCLCFVALNGVLMSANTLTFQNPIARTYYDELQSLPADSAVLVNAGRHSLGLFYALSTDTQLVPIVHPYMDKWQFEDYRMWLGETYGLESPEGATTLDLVELALREGRNVYFFGSDPELEECIIKEDINGLTRVTGVKKCREEQ